MTRFRVGDRVCGFNVTDFGAHAESVLVAEDGVIAPTPPNLTDEEAVAVFDGSITALPFLRDRARLRSGQRILINGASGAVGTAAIQLAKYCGATVTAVCSTENLELVASLGADAVIDYTAEDLTRNLDSYDVIFDAVAASSLARSKRTLKQGGIYLTTVRGIQEDRRHPRIRCAIGGRVVRWMPLPGRPQGRGALGRGGSGTEEVSVPVEEVMPTLIQGGPPGDGRHLEASHGADQGGEAEVPSGRVARSLFSRGEGMREDQASALALALEREVEFVVSPEEHE